MIIVLVYYSCVTFSLLILRVFRLPCDVEVSLDSKLERIFFFKSKQKQKLPQEFSKHIVLYGQSKDVVYLVTFYDIFLYFMSD